MKTTTMIKAKTRATTGMGVIQERLHGSTHRVGILKVKSQALGYSWGCVEKKVPSNILREKMCNYISRTIKYGNKVVGIVETYKDVRVTYKTNHMPKYLTIEDKKSEVKVQIQNQRIKI